MARQLISGLVLAAMLASPLSAQSISERGPGKFAPQSSGVVRPGAGAELRLTVPLGGGGQDQRAQLPRLDLNAGPAMVQGSFDGTRIQHRGQGALLNLRLTPGHSGEVKLAGQSLVTRYGPLAADEEREADKKDGGGPSTLGWIGIGVGVAAVTVLGVGYAVLTAGCYECDD